MKTKNGHIFNVFIAICLLLLVLVQVLNRSVYVHSHIMPDGSVFVHTHPYNKSSDNQPYKSHHHKQCELIIIDQWNSGFLLTFLDSLVIETGLSQGTVVCASEMLFDVFFGHEKGRAPPVC
jgi:hypothetical protein